MSLYQQWREMAEAERSQEAVEQFWNDYLKAETENYKKLLNEHDKLFSGKVSELAGQFNIEWYSPVGKTSDPDYQSAIWIPVVRK